jgi:hypothetical protein
MFEQVSLESHLRLALLLMTRRLVYKTLSHFVTSKLPSQAPTGNYSSVALVTN